jgi:hypothetical protein
MGEEPEFVLEMHGSSYVEGNLGSSNSWNPLDLSRPVIGLLYLQILR